MIPKSSLAFSSEEKLSTWIMITWRLWGKLCGLRSSPQGTPMKRGCYASLDSKPRKSVKASRPSKEHPAWNNRELTPRNDTIFGRASERCLTRPSRSIPSERAGKVDTRVRVKPTRKKIYRAGGYKGYEAHLDTLRTSRSSKWQVTNGTRSTKIESQTAK